jgi:hypothetical protein
MAAVKCKACGQPKQNHSKDLWDTHLRMHEAYKESLKRLAKWGRLK